MTGRPRPWSSPIRAEHDGTPLLVCKKRCTGPLYGRYGLSNGTPDGGIAVGFGVHPIV